MLKVNLPLFFLLLITVSLTACDKYKDNASPEQVNSKVLAYVNDSAISQKQLEHMKSRLFANQQPATNMDKVILESLVTSRAMSQKALSSMSAEEILTLDVSVAAYREELLMKRYLTSNVRPRPVTSEMVKKYYAKHPEKFSGGTQKTFEYITTYKKLTAEQRKKLLSLLKKADKQKNWKHWVKKNTSLPIKHQKATSNVSVLQEPLKRLVVNTKAGKISPLHVRDNIIIVRVISEKTLAPKPLEQVSAEIRKKLAPIKLRDAIKKAKSHILANSKVVYPDM